MLFKNIRKSAKTLLKNSSFHSFRFHSKPIEATLSVNDFSVDFEKLRDPRQLEVAERNIQERKGVGNIRHVLQLKQQVDDESDEVRKTSLYERLVRELKLLPNDTHPAVEANTTGVPRVMRPARRLQPTTTPTKPFTKLAKDLKVLRTDALNALTGPRSYYFIDGLAELEHALVRFALENLIRNKFKVVSVPDILPAELIERCGMTVSGDRAQVGTSLLLSNVGSELVT